MAIVMAGGQGSRLIPLTENRSKPAVPFGSRYRTIDFGTDVLPRLVTDHRIFAYDFATNEIGGIKAYE